MSLTVTVSWFPRSTGPAGPITLEDTTARVLDLLEHLDVTPDSVLVVRDDAPIPLDSALRDGDTLRIVHTVSGG